jgi:hypothetical protein
MALPINEISMVVSLGIVAVWAFFKFWIHKHKPNPEDIVDLITLLLLGPVVTIGILFILSAFNAIDLIELSPLRVNLGISGAILIGSSAYIYYIVIHRKLRKQSSKFG